MCHENVDMAQVCRLVKQSYIIINPINEEKHFYRIQFRVSSFDLSRYFKNSRKTIIEPAFIAQSFKKLLLWGGHNSTLRKPDS